MYLRMRITLQTFSTHFTTHTCDREKIIPLSPWCENLNLDQSSTGESIWTYELLDILGFVLVSHFLVIKKLSDVYCLHVRLKAKCAQFRNPEISPNTPLFSSIINPNYNSTLATIQTT